MAILWSDNPLRPPTCVGTWPFGWVLEEAAGGIVGSLANIPSLCTLGGRELVAATGRAWVVTPEYRGMALWLMDEYFNQEGVDLFINTTVNSMAVDPFTAFGSVRVPLGDWESAAYFIHQCDWLCASGVGIKSAPAQALLALPTGLALWASDRLRSKIPGSEASNAQVMECTSFDARFDQFWVELLKQNPEKLLGQRDAATLAWHFEGPLRAKQAWILTLMAGKTMIAYCICKRRIIRHQGSCECVWWTIRPSSRSADLLGPLMAFALRKCREQRLHCLEHVAVGLPKMAVLTKPPPTAESWRHGHSI